MLHLIQMRPVVRRLPVVIQWQEVWAEWVVVEEWAAIQWAVALERVVVRLHQKLLLM
jgi:hypothetical protein